MAKTEKLLIGPRLRRLRTQLGLTQTRMAEDLGISGSYLNLMERNQRAMSAKVLLKLSETYEIDLSDLTSGTDRQLVGELFSALRDPALGKERVPKSEVEDVVGASPATARALVNLHQRHTELSRRMLRDEGADEAASTLRDSVPATDLIQDVLYRARNYFDPLDRAAEALNDRMNLRRGEPMADLRARLRSHKILVRVLPYDLLPNMLRYFDRHSGRLNLSELLPDASRRFQVAARLALLEEGDMIDRIVADAKLPNRDAERLLRTTLANYFAAALLMPYGAFLKAAEDLRYDMDALAHRFGTSAEQVAHRLTTLNRSGARGVPLFFVRLDIAGNLSKRFSQGRFVFPRFGGLCPRWAIHEAFASPDRPIVQCVEMPAPKGEKGDRYLTIARRVTRAGGTSSEPAQSFVIGLGCDMSHASRLVYSDWLTGGLSGAPMPIGPNCYLCDRDACPQRAHPPLGRDAIHDDRARGLGQFAIGKEG
ncbi:short-chain fatty acyl-CoA regulator family protein [Algimonas porphyrae]|uniref:Transcriptional regulator n=1 Tax=Algimonas porphyrae TaxID=1128113 RepID=A0ABQ5V049_9PROT|nr:helix-turn-helix transcriptional regulator [Algimonas porphyrae]GLQ20928.1 transcriptional regulator [Algimonas porphyrae]